MRERTCYESIANIGERWPVLDACTFLQGAESTSTTFLMKTPCKGMHCAAFFFILLTNQKIDEQKNHKQP